MTKKELQKIESKKKKALRAHKASRVPITRDVVRKNDNCEDVFDIPKVITTDIGGKLLFGNIFAGYMQDTNVCRRYS